MRHNQNRRSRSADRKGPNPLTRSYESNGPDVKVRGTAPHVAEKYMSLARDAQSSGDIVPPRTTCSTPSTTIASSWPRRRSSSSRSRSYRDGGEGYDDDRQMNGRGARPLRLQWRRRGARMTAASDRFASLAGATSEPATSAREIAADDRPRDPRRPTTATRGDGRDDGRRIRGDDRDRRRGRNDAATARTTASRTSAAERRRHRRPARERTRPRSGADERRARGGQCAARLRAPKTGRTDRGEPKPGAGAGPPRRRAALAAAGSPPPQSPRTGARTAAARAPRARCPGRILMPEVLTGRAASSGPEGADPTGRLSRARGARPTRRLLRGKAPHHMRRHGRLGAESHSELGRPAMLRVAAGRERR